MARAMPGFYLILLPVLGDFISTGQAKEPCEIRALSPKVLVPLGEWVLLNCTFNCPGKIDWETRLQKRNEQLKPNWSSVEVLVDDWEKSKLFCLQLMDDGGSLEAVSVVMAYARPSNVTIDLDEELEEGKVHRAICTVYDVAPVENLQIQLLRANRVIHYSMFKEDGRKGKQMATATYEFTASRTDNLQNFSCLATLDVSAEDFITVSSSRVTVRTYGQPDVPVVTIEPDSNIQEGDSFNITCLSDGSPRPEYQWIVPAGANVTYTRNNSVVLVSRAGQVHNGNYTCEARNEHGWVRGSKTVRVIPPTKELAGILMAVIISSVFVVFVIIVFIFWKRRTRRSASRDLD